MISTLAKFYNCLCKLVLSTCLEDTLAQLSSSLEWNNINARTINLFDVSREVALFAQKRHHLKTPF